MKAAGLIALLGALGLTTTTALPQEHYRDDERDERPRRKREVPEAGFWPTPVMAERFIERLVERQMAGSFDFDDDQTYSTQELIKERVLPWLQENRPEIQRVVNEFVEAWLDDRPPSSEWVAEWAQRALPLVDGLVEQVETVGEDMRTYLTDEQQVTLDAHLAGMRAATGMTMQRLGGWAAGSFDRRTDWHRSPEYGPAEIDRVDATNQAIVEAKSEVLGGSVAAGPGHGSAAAAAEHTPRPAAPSQPKDEWTKYTEEFIRRYKLNAEQQSRAYKHLRAQQEQRDGYLRRNQAKFAHAQQTLEEAKSERERARAEAILAERAKTLNNKFTILKQKLDTLPTRKQRLAAAEKSKIEHAAHQEAGAKRESPSSP